VCVWKLRVDSFARGATRDRPTGRSTFCGGTCESRSDLHDNARPSPGLSNAFWGGSIALAVVTPERRRSQRIVIGLVFGLVAVIWTAGLVVGAEVGVGWGVAAGVAAFVTGMVVVLVVERRITPSSAKSKPPSDQ
jgi:peptidoglycan/LPS O-acetylase OafA/YrhL